MKQYNYAVDMLGLTQSERTYTMEYLEGIAEVNNWTELGWFDYSKRYFRFKMIIDPKDFTNSELKEPGFYFWSCDSMKDNDYQSIRIEQAVEYLRKIDKSILEESTVSGFHIQRKSPSKLQIGCREVSIADMTLLLSLKNKYSIPQINILTQGQCFQIDNQAAVLINKIINKKKG